MLVTGFAVVPIMALGFHVLIGIVLSVEFLSASFALNFGLPVTGVIIC